MVDTIFALSSGSPPAAIAVLRLSGPSSGQAVARLAGPLPQERRASLRTLRSSDSEVLDRALVLWFPGPRTATGEDLAELHCHGGRSVVAAIERELTDVGLRRAEPGEFTRRAFANGVIDLAEAEGLGDLLTAETELQRRAAEAAVSGGLSAKVEAWRSRLLALSALVEAQLDFGDEDDVGGLPNVFHVELDHLTNELTKALEAPRAERLRDGVRVVLAGPPNTGKSSLFNALLDEGAAIVSAEAGTTRDAIERPVALAGVPFVFVDTAGLREDGAGEIERIGIDRARAQLERADIVLWLGDQGQGPDGSIKIAARSDLTDKLKEQFDYKVSAVTGFGIDNLVDGLISRARDLLPRPGEATLNIRQAATVSDAVAALRDICPDDDPLITAERMRIARSHLDRFLGRHSTEDMLDSLFGRFCIGK